MSTGASIEIYESDWVNATPVFYNKKTLRVGKSMSEVISDQWEFHPEGVRNYLTYGYAVFGQTPVDNVCFLPPSTRLTIDRKKGTYQLQSINDDVQERLQDTTSEHDVITLLRDRIHRAEMSWSGAVIIPTSGGFDSRLLHALIQNKKNVHAYTYGISTNQSSSFEVVLGETVAKKMGVPWDQVHLDNAHAYLPTWVSYYGAEMHAHGMYQMEFYDKIAQKQKGTVISGIVGDIWAGNLIVPKLKKDSLYKLGYTHGMHADPYACHLPKSTNVADAYWETHEKVLQNPKRRVLEAMRMKLMLLRYLVEVPTWYGFDVWTPFLDKDIALAMLNLPEEKRRNRKWQRDFFTKEGLLLEKDARQQNRQNTLNYQMALKHPLKPLREDVLSEIVNPAYVAKINQQIAHLTPTKRERWQNDVAQKSKYIRGAMRMVHRPSFNDRFHGAYGAYMTLKPLEDLLIKRNR